MMTKRATKRPRGDDGETGANNHPARTIGARRWLPKNREAKRNSYITALRVFQTKQEKILSLDPNSSRKRLHLVCTKYLWLAFEDNRLWFFYPWIVAIRCQ